MPFSLEMFSVSKSIVEVGMMGILILSLMK